MKVSKAKEVVCPFMSKMGINDTIADLRNQGLDIITRKITRNGKCFASYELKETE